MKALSKPVLAISFAVTAFLSSGSLLAASISGALGDSSAATDYYRVTCSTNAAGATDLLSVSVLDLAPKAAPMISVQVIKALLGQNTTDAVDGDTGFSPTVNIKGGNGVYDVRVNKTAKGPELYKLKYQCINSAGKATATAIATLQNQ